MSTITFTMKDGTERRFPHEGRPGGSYTKRLSYEGAFAVVTDEFGRKTAVPASDIAEIVEVPTRW